MSSAAFKLFQRCLADIQAADKRAVKKAKKYIFFFLLNKLYKVMSLLDLFFEPENSLVLQ